MYLNGVQLDEDLRLDTKKYVYKERVDYVLKILFTI